MGYGMRKIISAMALLCALASDTEARTQHFSHGYAGRPAAWCGWYMRSQVGSDPGPEYNLARAWAHFGVNASGPTVGVIVVWRHHVGKIVGRENGQCRAAMTRMLFGRARGHWRAQLRFDAPTRGSNLHRMLGLRRKASRSRLPIPANPARRFKG